MNKRGSYLTIDTVPILVLAVVATGLIIYFLSSSSSDLATGKDSKFSQAKNLIKIEDIKPSLNIGGGNEEDKACRKYNSYQACMGLDAKNQKTSITKCFWGRAEGKVDCFSCENEEYFKNYYGLCKGYNQVFTSFNRGELKEDKLVFLSAFQEEYKESSEIYKTDKSLCESNPCGFNSNKECKFKPEQKEPKVKITAISCS